MNQNLSSYWIFYVVANTGNISRAAKELFISQPAISKSIQKLEESLGCKLFARSSRGVILTEEGALLYDHVKDAFESLNEGEDKLKRSIELGIGHLSIGVSSTLCKHILLPYLQEFIRKNPHISISISCQSSNETLKLLEDNKIDIGLVANPHNQKNLVYYPVSEIEDCFVATPSYIENLNARYDSSSQLLEKGTLMLLDKNNLTRQHTDLILAAEEVQPSEIIEISNMELLIECAKVGVGIASVIRSFVADELFVGELVEIPLAHRPEPREVGFAYKENRNPSSSLSAFLEFYEHYNQ